MIFGHLLPNAHLSNIKIRIWFNFHLHESYRFQISIPWFEVIFSDHQNPNFSTRYRLLPFLMPTDIFRKKIFSFKFFNGKSFVHKKEEKMSTTYHPFDFRNGRRESFQEKRSQAIIIVTSTKWKILNYNDVLGWHQLKLTNFSIWSAQQIWHEWNRIEFIWKWLDGSSCLYRI